MTNKNIEKNYYLNLHIQQQEIIDSQKLNLKMLEKENQRSLFEINQNQKFLEEVLKVKKKKLFFVCLYIS